MSKKLLEKSLLIGDPPLAQKPNVALDTEHKTGLGGTMERISQIKKIQKLEKEVESYKEQIPLRLIDASKIKPSKFANRHELNFEAADFDVLKIDISGAGGNTQPIKIRPIGEGVYEIVFGHRRHRACLELGIPVLAMIEEVSDQKLWLDMDRENRERKNPSMYEQGVSYKLALKEGLFPSIRQMALVANISNSYISRCIQVADLPSQVINAFESPMAITSKMMVAIGAALSKDPDGVLMRAATAKKNGMATAPQVMAWILDSTAKTNSFVVEKEGKPLATITTNKGVVTIKSNILDVDRVTEWLKNY